MQALRKFNFNYWIPSPKTVQRLTLNQLKFFLALWSTFCVFLPNCLRWAMWSVTKPQARSQLWLLSCSVPPSLSLWGFLGGAHGKEPSCQCRRLKRCRPIPGWGRALGGGHGNLLQYSYLENPKDTRAWCAIVCGGAKNWTMTEATQHLISVALTFPR